MPPPERHQQVLLFALEAALGRFVRFYAAIFIGLGGFVLALAWTMGPQQLVEAHRYSKLTAKADAKIVERWVALEWKPKDAERAPDWRNVAKATPCVVVEYDGAWGSQQRAFCGTRFPFNREYRLHELSELAPGVAFAWSRDARGLLATEVRMAPELRAYLAQKPPIPPAFPSISGARTALELLQLENAQPVERTIRGWSSQDVAFPLAVDPDDPAQSWPQRFIANRLAEPRPWLAAIVAGAFGLAIYTPGMLLLFSGLPPLTRVLMAVIPLLALPWWGEHLPRSIAKLNEDFGEVIEDMVGDIDRLGRLTATDPGEALMASGERIVFDPVVAPYAQTFGRLALKAPASPAASTDEAFGALHAVVAAQARTWSASDRQALFANLTAEKQRSLYDAGLAFVPLAAEAVAAPGEDEPTRLAARAFLSEWVTQPVLEPHPGDAAFATRVAIYRALQRSPVPVIANPAGWIADRATEASKKR
ncbi:hypothetical protein DSM104443_03051 [Usitatibacter rugosus]|uniref:Uncharacterized protein n=1 Tax=Usitatibacter rugosus TaxID=2732067 RepID=A0A6M4GYJ5_9PROT|nr:hypothetical protein [Usitatibacter rugosus]QJR11968.1 hypothetical protein DSM104443_03051 [Usitatibacter rugosus]